MICQDRLSGFVKEELLSICPEEPFDENTNLLALGLDSLKMMRLVVFIEEERQLVIPDERVNPRVFSTLKSILELVEQVDQQKNGAQ